MDIRLRTGKDSTLPKPLQQYAEITVTDSGIGIAPKETEHIFERFYQIRNSQNNSNIGTGIGRTSPAHWWNFIMETSV